MTPFTAQDWPIAAAMMALPAALDDGTPIQDADPEHWRSAFAEVRELGFGHADLTDNWVRPGDLSEPRLDALGAAAREAGITPASISVIRRSVIDARQGEDNLAYSHRSLDAAARLGVGTVSFGLHQALTLEQQRQLWFWTVAGHRDDPEDREAWQRAVDRLRELGRHAADLGIVVSLEMYEDTYLGSADSAVALVEAIDHENVGLNPDIGNLIRLHRPIEPWWDAFEKVLPWSNFWHVKNYQRDEDRAEGLYTAMPASLELGLINYRRAVRHAIACGFQGVICTEHYGGDGLGVSATNARYLRESVLPKNTDYTPGQSRVRQPSR